MLRALASLCCVVSCSSAFAAHIGENLCPPATATHTAVQSGSWQDATTWTPAVPGAGARVLIPNGVTVTNHAKTADVLWIHAAGTLTVCDHCDTQINVHTLYVPMGGAVRLGMPNMPAVGKTVLEFLGGPFLPGDWEKVSRGVICHGEFMACGTEKTAWGIVDGDLAVGATTLVLKDLPYQWKAGDRILIAGTDSAIGERREMYQSEVRTIVNVNSRTVRFDSPLTYRHFRWRSDLPFHCANLTRNVVIRSRSSSTPATRGHLMFMSGMNDIRYTEEVGLGRTDKSVPVTDPRKDSRGVLVPGSDANPRGRYADHVHRAGPQSEPSRRMWVVVDGSPGWGMVNHASHCQWDNCIAVRCFGSAFVTEEGQERGHMRRCFAALNKGQGDTITSTDSDHGIRLIGDWGKDGSGFWLQGGLVEVSDCVSCDNSGRGFALFNLPLNSHPDYGQAANVVPAYLQYPIVVEQSLLPVDYLRTPWWLAVKPSAIPSGLVPQRLFSRNTAYGNKVGLQSWFCATNNTNIASRLALPVAVRGNITDMTIWGRGAMCHLEYTRQFNVDGLKVIGDGIFRSEHLSITKWKPALLVRFPNITVLRFDSAGMTKRVENVGTAADKATQRIQ